LLAVPPEQSPFYSPARRDDSPEVKSAFLALVRDQINPAVLRYQEFLKKEYLKAARDAIGVSANPDGAACYRGSLRFMTSLDKTPDQLHQLGLSELEKIETEMKALSAKSFGGEDLRTLFQKFRTDKKYLYRDREEMIRDAQAAVDRATARHAAHLSLAAQGGPDHRADPSVSGKDLGAALSRLRASTGAGRRLIASASISPRSRAR